MMMMIKINTINTMSIITNYSTIIVNGIKTKQEREVPAADPRKKEIPNQLTRMIFKINNRTMASELTSSNL